MSGLKARLVKPTGLEFYDLAIAINTAIWNFVKFEFKNKAAKDAGDKRKDSEKTVSAIPTRYWQTHAVPLHREFMTCGHHTEGGINDLGVYRSGPYHGPEQ